MFLEGWGRGLCFLCSEGAGLMLCTCLGVGGKCAFPEENLDCDGLTKTWSLSPSPSEVQSHESSFKRHVNRSLMRGGDWSTPRSAATLWYIWVLMGKVVLWDPDLISFPHKTATLECVLVSVSECVQTCPVTAVTPMVPTFISLFPFISCCRLGSEATRPAGTDGNCSSVCRDFLLFTERFS